MAITVSQAVEANSGTSLVASIAPSISATTAGNLLVAVFALFGSGTLAGVAISDSASQTWTAGPTAVIKGSTAGELVMFYKANSSSITTVTFKNTTSGGDLMAGCFFEIAGCATTSPADVTATATTGGTSNKAPTVTGAALAQAVEIAIGGIGWESGSSETISSVTTGWNLETFLAPGSVPNSFVLLQPVYQITSATTALTLAGTISATGSSWWGDVFMTFKAAAAAAGYFPPVRAFGYAVNRASDW
jgi:hypothetical protein